MGLSWTLLLLNIVLGLTPPSYGLSPLQVLQGVLPTAAQMRRLVGLFASLTLKV